MKYQPPVGGDAGDPYVDFNAVTGESGSIPPAVAIEAPQRELDHLITFVGLTPNEADNTQVRQAIQQMIIAGAKTVKITEATFDAGVGDGNAVLWDVGAGEFALATADGTAANRAVGLADVTNSEVILFGETRAGLVSGLTPGGRYYLDAATPGAMTATAPDDRVRMGVAKSATQFFVDVDAGDGGAIRQGKHTVNLPARTWREQVTNGCSTLTLDESDANDVLTQFRRFSNGSTTYAQTGFRMPKSMQAGATIAGVIEWKEQAGATAHDCVWQVQMQAQGDGDAIDGAWGAAVTAVDTGSTGSRRFAEFTAVTPVGDPQQMDRLLIRLARVGGDGSDTLDVGADFIEMQIYPTINLGNDN